MMKRSRLLIAAVTAILLFTVGTLLAVAELQELSLLKNNLKDHIPQDYFRKEENRCWQLILNFLMLAIGGSLLSFSVILHGIRFRNRLYDKLSAMIGLAVVFIMNFIVPFDSVWVIFTGLTIIVTFDCVFIFIREGYESLTAKKKAKKIKKINDRIRSEVCFAFLAPFLGATILRGVWALFLSINPNSLPSKFPKNLPFSRNRRHIFAL